MFDLAAIRKIHEKFEAQNALMVQRQTEEAGKFAVDYVTAHPTFKPRTSNLQKQTDYRVIRTASGRVLKIQNRAKYAAAIDSGSKPHVIVPRRRKMLRFYANGGVVFARRVNHPGNRPYKFLYRATTAAGRILEQSLRVQMDQLARQF